MLRRLAFAAFVVIPVVQAHADELQDVSKLVAAGSLDDAEKRADAFLAKMPKDAQMRFLKGVILAQRGRRDDALAMFTGITQDFPELPEPYNNLAVIHAARGEYDDARLALEMSIRVSPRYATAYENLGDVYAALAARAYQDARRYDANNGAAVRKLDATRALLTVPASSASSTPPAPSVAKPAPVTTASPVVDTTRSQRNVGLPSPAGPRVTVGGTGAVAPEIVVPANATSVPQGSNVVAIEAPPAAEERNATAPLAGARTVVGADPAPALAVNSAVMAAVQRWAKAHALTTTDLSIRIDGDTAVARFRETSLKGSTASILTRALTLRKDEGAWNVVEDRKDP